MRSFSDEEIRKTAMQKVENFFKGATFCHLRSTEEDEPEICTNPLDPEDLTVFDSEWAKAISAEIEDRYGDRCEVIVTCEIKWEGEEKLDRAEQLVCVYMNDELIAEVGYRIG